VSSRGKPFTGRPEFQGYGTGAPDDPGIRSLGGRRLYDGAYENALAYAQQREQFGKPIGGFQLVQDLLVKMLGNITSSQTMCFRLSQLQDTGRLKDEHASLAKAFCTVKMRECVGWARNYSAPMGSCSITTSAGLSLTPRPSTRMRVPAR